MARHLFSRINTHGTVFAVVGFSIGGAFLSAMLVDWKADTVSNRFVLVTIHCSLGSFLFSGLFTLCNSMETLGNGGEAFFVLIRSR